MPILAPFTARERLRLAVGLFVNVAAISLVTVWAGEPLLHVLGLTTAALSATGGISLMLAAVPLMRGTGETPPEPEQAAVPAREPGSEALIRAGAPALAGAAPAALMTRQVRRPNGRPRSGQPSRRRGRRLR